MNSSSGATRSRRVIYDFGANNGDDVPYYLLKGDVVVAVEANPALAEGMRRRFAAQIDAGRVVVENCVLTADAQAGVVPFFLHKTNHVLSQFPEPAPQQRHAFTPASLPARPLAAIIADHGEPYYVKVDLEHYDAVVLEALFGLGIRPPYISSEAHSVDTFCHLVAGGRYRAFKLIEGESVAKRFADHIVKGPDGDVRYRFPHHSAGPFGEDIPGPWLSATHMFKLLALHGSGWKDIHATTTVEPEPGAVPRVALGVAWKFLRRQVGARVRGALRGGPNET